MEPYLTYKIKPMWIKWENIETVHKRVRIKIQCFRNCGAGEDATPNSKSIKDKMNTFSDVKS